MENSVHSKKTIRMKCPECLNFLIANVNDNKCITGICPVCKAIFFSKQRSEKEKIIRIVKR